MGRDFLKVNEDQIFMFAILSLNVRGKKVMKQHISGSLFKLSQVN